MNLSTFPGRSMMALALIAVMAVWSATASAGTISEDFDGVSVNGDGVTLSNGWFVQGGTFSSSVGSSYYSVVFDSDYKPYGNTGKALYNEYGSTVGEAYVIIPKVITGDVKFNYRSTLTDRSKYTSVVKVYQVTESDGVYTVGTELWSANPKKGGSWSGGSEVVNFTIDGATMIAIQLFRSYIDNFEATLSDGGEVKPVEKKALTITDFQLTSEDGTYSNPIKANEANQFTATFSVKVKNTGNVELPAEEVSVSLKNADRSVTYATATATEALAADAEVEIPVTVTADAGELGEYNYNTFTFYAWENVGNVRYATQRYIYVTPSAAKFTALYDGWRLTSDDVINFGTSNVAMTRTVTVKNEGTAPLAVSNIELPEGYSVAETAFEVAAGATKDVVITLTPAAPYGVKSGNVTITHALGSLTFAVKGTAIDPSIYFVNFEDGKIPASWTELNTLVDGEGNPDTGNYWSINNQGNNKNARQSTVKGATALVTQRLTVAEGETMTVDAKRAFAYSASTLTVSYSADQQTWTDAGVFALTSAWETFTVSGIPAGDWYLKFEGQYVDLDNVAGFHEAADAPVLAVYYGETALADEYLFSFDIINADDTYAFTVKNEGTGTLTAAIAIEGEGFSVDTESVSLAAGESQDITVTIAAQPWGIKIGQLTIGEMKIGFEGESRDPEMLFVDFEDGLWPEGWAAGSGWTVYSKMAEHYDYNAVASDLVTAKVLVEEGMSLRFDAKRSTDSYDSSLKLYYSNDRKNWTEKEFAFELPASEAGMHTFDISLPEGSWYVKFEGCNVNLDNITGVKLSKDVDHIVTWTADVPAEGMVNNEYTTTLTLTNEGIDGETVKVYFYQDSQAVLSEEVTLAFNQAKTFTYVFTPSEAGSFDAYWEVIYGDDQFDEKSEAVTVTVKAEEGESITFQGTVTEKDSDPAQALEGVVVTLTCGEIVYTATTDAEGKYAMTVFKFGTDYRYTLTAELEGYENYIADPYYVNAFGETTVTEDIALTKNTATAVQYVATESQQPAQAYTIGGQRVKNIDKKGLYIINGKKVIK